MMAGAPRVKLDGTATQAVTEHEATTAKCRLAFLRDRIKAACVVALEKVRRENGSSRFAVSAQSIAGPPTRLKSSSNRPYVSGTMHARPATIGSGVMGAR
jgi:sRNA-binding protein